MSQRQVKGLFGSNVHSSLVVCPSKKTLSVTSADWTAVTCKHCLKSAPQPKKITAATINAQLKKLGIAERLVQGNGYVYFIEGEASSWYSSSIPVCYVSHVIEEVDGVPNLEATMAYVLRERDSLRKSGDCAYITAKYARKGN